MIYIHNFNKKNHLCKIFLYLFFQQSKLLKKSLSSVRQFGTIEAENLQFTPIISTNKSRIKNFHLSYLKFVLM